MLLRLISSLFTNRANSLNESAEFADFFERRKVLKSSNDGLLLDGKSLRLSSSSSYEHLALIARTGGGKTSRYIIPNILTLNNCSMVITDPSGEIHKKTADKLLKKGFNIKVINPTSLKESLQYNPLDFADDYDSINEISKILIRSANPNSSPNDSFWLSGAEKILNIIILSLKAKDRELNQKKANLQDVKNLLNQFGTEEFNKYVARYADSNTYSEYKGFLNGNEKTIQSFLSTAQVSLDFISNPNNSKLLERSTINFQELRYKKTAFFIIVPEQKLPLYTFLLNLIYTQLFNFCMSVKTEKNLPMYFLLDEFGHLSIPNFSTIITTIRKYKVSISIILQSISQLESRYSKSEANTILNGGISSKVFFSGADLSTTQMLEQILGKSKIEKSDKYGNIGFKEESLLSSSSIRTLDDDKAIFIYANKKPILLKLSPYYKQKKFI